MKRINQIFFLSFVLTIVLFGVGCTKNKPYPTIQPVPEVHFISSTPYLSYYVEDTSTSSFTVQIGTTNVASTDRTVTFNISSPTGAISGTNYQVTSPATGNSVVIPAGQATASIVIHGIFAAYGSGARKDTLTFTLSEPSLKVADFNDTVQVVLQRYCAVNLDDLLGDYNHCYDNQSPDSYGPYTATVVSATATGPTSATLVIKNFGAAAFGAFGPNDASANPGIIVNIDWANPANFFTTLPSQPLSVDPTYGTITVGQVGKASFSSCDNTISASYSATVSAGSFGNFATVLKR